MFQVLGMTIKPCIMANHRVTAAPVGEPSVIVICIFEIIGRAIVKVMQARFFHRVVCGADPYEGCDVGEFAHGGIGNVGKSVAI